MAYSINTGKRKFEIAVDDVEGGVINLYFNPTDTNMLLRYEEFNKKLNEKLEELPQGEIKLDKNGQPELEEVAGRIKAISDLIYESYDNIFGEGTSKELFKYCNPMSLLNGEPFAVAIGKVVSLIIRNEGKKEQPKYEKYMKKYAK